MAWLNKLPVEKPHKCYKPTLRGIGSGSRWRCDSCGLVWVVIGSGFDRRWSYLPTKPPTSGPKGTAGDSGAN